MPFAFELLNSAERGCLEKRKVYECTRSKGTGRGGRRDRDLFSLKRNFRSFRVLEHLRHSIDHDIWSIMLNEMSGVLNRDVFGKCWAAGLRVGFAQGRIIEQIR